MRRPLVFLVLALGALGPALAAPLRIGVEAADRPISFVDPAGQPSGFTAALIAAMGRAGLGEVELVPGAWTDIARKFQAGQLDALANVARTEERLRDMDFSIAHAYVHAVVYFPRNRPPLRTIADFPGKTVGALNGSLSLSHALTHAGWGATVRAFATPQAALEATRRGECDGVLFIHGLEGKYIVDTRDLTRGFVDDIIHEFRFAVHKGDSASLAGLNDALAVVRSDGTFDRLYSKWLGPIEPHPIRLADLRPYTLPILLGLAAVAAIFLWQRHMLARVSSQARALQESEERFHGIVEAAFEGWIIHQEGRIVMANAAYAATFGYTVAELVGRPILDLTPPEAHAVVAAAIAARRTTPYETLGLHQNGTRIPVLTAGQPCTFQGRPARIAAVRELTAEKQAAADQLVLSKLESTGILAGGIAHDFNNLLAALVLNLDLALADQRPHDPTAPFLHAAKHAALSARTLTQQLITFACGEASVRQPTDLGALLGKHVPLALSGSNVRAEISVAPDLRRAEADAGQIERVVGNLVLNAREAMPGGGVITVRAENAALAAGEIATLPAGDYVRLAFTDRGYGIPPEIVAKIFDPYFSTKARGAQKGMGLGLTICHSIVQQHGGALTVDSHVGLGTTFLVYLPATIRAAATPPPAAPAGAPPAGRILVMDDEALVRETVCHALVHAGYTVEAAADGRAAVELFARARTEGRPFDAALLDLTVRGGMGGLEAMPALRALRPALPVVVMSGYAQEAVLRDYAHHGFDAALAKPFELDALFATVARVLRR